MTYLLRGLTVALLAASTALCASAQEPAGQVRVGARLVFVIEAPSGAISPAERAEIVNRRIEEILTRPELDPARIDVRTLPDGSPVLVLDALSILSVNEEDARRQGNAPRELAETWARNLRTAATQVKPLAMRQRASVPVHFLEEHRVLLLLVQVSLLLLGAHFCGEVMRRMGQAPVIGHLLAGVLLGQSFFGWIWPDLEGLVFPHSQTQSYLLEVVSWLGVIFLLTLTGMETDLELIRRQARTVLSTCAWGLPLSFAAGLAVGYAIPDELLVAPEQRGVFAFYMAAALAISSVPVVAKILLDMGVMRRNVGQTILATAILYDTTGMLVLGVVAGLAGGGEIDLVALGRSVLGTAAYVLVLFTLGRRWIFSWLRWIHDRVHVEEVTIATVTALVLLSAAVTQFLGVHAVLGAFLMGVVLRQSSTASELTARRLEGLTMGVFAPIFFASAGIHVNLRLLGDWSLLRVTLLITGAACLGTLLGCYLGGRRGGLSPWEAASLALGVNARGAMGLIVAILGFSLGLLTVDIFSAIVFMALFTTIITPGLLRWSLAHTVPDDEEKDRLAREELQATSFFGAVHRVLLPTHGGPGASAASQILRWLARTHPLEVTPLMVVGDRDDSPAPLREAMESLAGEGISLSPKSLRHPRVVEGILEEARRGYQLLVMGCGHGTSGHSSMFGTIVDEAICGSPCAVLVVRGPAHEALEMPRSILLPTAGRAHGSRAAELAVAVARATGAQLRLLHVLEQHPESLFWTADLEAEREVAREVVEEVSLQGELQGISMSVSVLEAALAGPAIVEAAVQHGSDLIVISVARRLARRLFLGRTVPHVLAHAPGAVAVLVA